MKKFICVTDIVLKKFDQLSEVTNLFEFDGEHDLFGWKTGILVIKQHQD
jgi:hypothetical protein